MDGALKRPPAWSPLFRSQLALLFGLSFSSAGSLARYVPGVLLATKMLIAGVFFGLGLACFFYAVATYRSMGKSREAVTRREQMILAPVAGLVVAMLVMRALLLFQGH